jgi:hypothetical protein
LAYFPEWKEYCQELKRKYDAMIEDMEKAFESLKHITDSKEFAIKAKGYWFFFLLFLLHRNQQKSPREYYALADQKEAQRSWQNPKRKS